MFFQEPLGKLAAGRKDWKPEKWGEYILQTFFELFESLLTYLSNTMSFLRVAAFVLIHAGMMMAVFSLAGLFGPVGYIVAVVLGNVLVTAMEAPAGGHSGHEAGVLRDVQPLLPRRRPSLPSAEASGLIRYRSLFIRGVSAAYILRR